MYAKACARLVLQGDDVGARVYAARAMASRDLWQEMVQQWRDVRREETAA
jgi:hypothetical protein